MAEFSAQGLSPEGLALGVVDLSRTAAAPLSGAYRGDAAFYPASVVKAFYLVFYEVEKAAGRLKGTPELARAVRDMITVSSNDATGFVLDCLTGTTSGPEIADPKAWATWKSRRNAVNRFFQARGYVGLNANQKTFCEDAYGREQAFRDGGKNRNSLTADAATRLFEEIATGAFAGPAGTEEMLRLLARDIAAEKPFEDFELEDARLCGRGLPPGTRMWSKSGDAYDVHHLVALVELPNGRRFVLAALTKGVKKVPGVLPRIFELVAEHMNRPAARANELSDDPGLRSRPPGSTRRGAM